LALQAAQLPQRVPQRPSVREQLASREGRQSSETDIDADGRVRSAGAPLLGRALDGEADEPLATLAAQRGAQDASVLVTRQQADEFRHGFLRAHRPDALVELDVAGVERLGALEDDGLCVRAALGAETGEADPAAGLTAPAEVLEREPERLEAALV
jgi:hypothetical protein